MRMIECMYEHGEERGSIAWFISVDVKINSRPQNRSLTLAIIASRYQCLQNARCGHA